MFYSFESHIVMVATNNTYFNNLFVFFFKHFLANATFLSLP